jgi:hypothetical protein
MNRRNFLKNAFSITALGLASPVLAIDQVKKEKTINSIVNSNFNPELAGWAEKLLMTDNLPQGAAAKYSRYDYDSWIIYNKLKNIEIVKSSNCIIPIHEFSCKSRDMIKCRNNIQMQRDGVFSNLILNGLPRIEGKNYAKGDLSWQFINDGFSMMEDNLFCVAYVSIHPVMKDKLIEVMKNSFSYCKYTSSLDKRIAGMLWTSDVILTDRIPKNVIILSAPTEYIGVLPIRTEYIHLGDDGYMESGMGIVNSGNWVILEIV